MKSRAPTVTIALLGVFGAFALGVLLAPHPAATATSGEGGDLQCLIEPQHVVHLGSAVEGLLDSVNVDRGARVKKGDVVATLESGAEKTSLDLARERARLRGQLAEAQARVDFGQRDLARYEKLRAQDIVAERLYDEAKTNLKRSSADLEAAYESLTLAKLEVDHSEALLERRRVRAPIDGVVTRRLLQPGEYVNNKEILEIAQLDPLRVEVLVPAAFYGQIHVGTEAMVTPEDLGTKPQAAFVTVVDPLIDAASSTFGVRLELPNAARSLPAGLRCRLRFLTGVAQSGAPAVPAAQAP